jgi:hypothetical protein
LVFPVSVARPPCTWTEFILGDLGFRETLADGFLDLHVGLGRMIAGRARSRP